MDKRSFLIFSIKQFEEKAFELITLMCDNYDLDMESVHPFLKLQSRSAQLWKGEFQKWQYRFHGDSCQFIHTETGQLLDIKTNREGNYGAIDPFYLFRFIHTTQKLKEINPFQNSNDGHEVYDQLKSQGIVINIGSDYLPTWVLNENAL